MLPCAWTQVCDYGRVYQADQKKQISTTLILNENPIYKDIHNTMAQVTLITTHICPFAHRAWLTLLEKEVPFNVHKVDLRNKDAFFKEHYAKAYASSPNSDGMVPVLIHGDRILAESDLIAWYIAETFPTGTQLIPEDNFQKLKMRRFIGSVPGKLITGYYSPRNWGKLSEKEKEAAFEKIKAGFEAIESQLEGPFVLGEQFSLADILLYPWLERWPVLTHYVKSEIPVEYKKVHAFIEAMQSRESVKRARSEVSDEYYIKGYASYFQS